MSAELLIANMLRVASEDLDGARARRRQQSERDLLVRASAEKVIRAVVTSEGKHAGIKHELAEIVDLIPDENPLKVSLRKIEHLSQYATAYRYPVSSSRTKRIPQPPSADDLRDAIVNTAAALSDAVAVFKVDLQHADTPARFAGPIR